MIPRRDETAGAVSALSFSRRTFGSSSWAARSNIGAIARQGPHQGAQTSTSTGMSLLRDVAAKACLRRPRSDGR